MDYLKDVIAVVVGLVLAVFIAMAIATVMSSLAFNTAVEIYGSRVEANPIKVSAEVQGLEVKEPHGYEHFRVEHQRDLR